MEGYEGELVGKGEGREQSKSAPASVRRVLKLALKRKWHHLAEERIEDVKPVIPLGKCFWPLSKVERKEIIGIFKAPEVRLLITSFKGRRENDKVEVLDAAYWMKGCSSLGRLRFAVLVRVGNKKKKNNELCLIDIKEAVLAAAPHSVGNHMPRDHARRVVEGARKLSPFLGQRMLSWRFSGSPVVLRELLSQDLKLEMDQLTRDEAIGAARFLASVVGQAHAKQMNEKSRKAWAAELGRHRSKSLDAPSWLWTSVVELVASHESAYLEHCRQFAMKAAAR
jgi:uncharacterized protein (DUF2252 family)